VQIERNTKKKRFFSFISEMQPIFSIATPHSQRENATLYIVTPIAYFAL
jgi:hypothetical protein